MRIVQKGRCFRLAGILIAVVLGSAGVFGQPQMVPVSFAEIAKKVEPAVVSIEAKSKTAESVVQGDTKSSDPDNILDLFRRQAPLRPVYHVGSGFIVDGSGYIVTNNHVVSDTSRLTVKLDSGEEFTAKVVGVDDETDIAILKIDAGRELPSVKFGDSDKMQVGDWVLAMGSPFGLAKSVSAGIVSQTQRDTPGASAFQRFIQTDAVINPGNSGGPLVNMAGEVIGVNSQIATQTGEFSGVGFALPSDETRNVYNEIVAAGKVRRGYLGAYLDSVKAEFAKVYGLPEARGAFVTDVRDKMSPAGKAGLQTGDIILEFNGKPISSAQDLIAKVASTRPDGVVDLVYLRDTAGKLEQRSTKITLGERPTAARPDDDDTSGRRTLPVKGSEPEVLPFGLSLTELTAANSKATNFDGMTGLIVKDVNPASYLADVRTALGFQALVAGDLIVRVNRQPVGTLANFTALAGRLKPGDAVVLQVASYNPALRIIQTKFVQFTVR